MNLKSESSVLEAAQLAVSATEREESVRLQMETYGLTPAFRQKGSSLIDKARSCQASQVSLYNEQWSLSQQLNAELDAVHTQFKEHTKVIRIAYRKDAGLLHSLKIDRFAKQAWPLVRQAEYFYTRVLEQELNLQPFGVSRKELEQAQALVAKLLDMKETRTRKKGMAENCTQEKNAAFKELRSWIAKFRMIARLAFKDHPQMLEIFGMPVVAKV